MITLKNINLSSIDLSGIDLRGIKLGLGGRGGGSGDGFPQLPGDVTRWHFGGLTNEMMAAMDDPRIEDADGKGRFLSFKNFAWKGMSGCGGYSLSKEIFSYTPAVYSLNFTEPGKGIKEFDVYFQLIDLDENSGVSFNLDIRESGTAKRIKRETYTKDGIYHFEYKSEDDATNLYMIGYNGTGAGSTTFTVKILPYYAGALVFDGVDDYGICDNFPILTKEKGYTVVALRQIISTKASSVVSKFNASNDGAFLFEGYNLAGEYISGSFGTFVNDIEKSPFSYMTSVSYNGTSINPGNKLDKSNTLAVGTFYNDVFNHYFGNIALWELIILDHDATEEELTKIKDFFVKTYPWLFPDQAWTVVGKTNEDEDRATIANITGNGNDLVLSNFGFAEGSGYNEEGEYAGYLVTDGVDDYVRSSNDFTLGKKFTAVGEWELLDNTTVLSGIAKNVDFFLYSNINGLSFYCKQGNLPTVFNGIKSLTAFNSEGLAYDHKWEKYVCEKTGDEAPKTTRFIIGNNNNTFAKVAFKNMAMYAEKVLSKEDMIKAYIYLQTLKAK